MKLGKRLLAVVLAMLMVIGITGCGGGSDETANGETKLLWYVIGSKQRDMESVMTEFNNRVKEKLGFTVDIQVIDAGTYTDKMNMIISSGENFDMCFTSSWSNDFLKNAKNGAFYALDELLAEEQDFYNSIPEYTWNSARIDGQIMAVPNYQSYTYYEAAAIPKRFIDKYNVDVESIHNLQDLEPYFEQIKANEQGIYPLDPKGFNMQTQIYYGTGAPGVGVIDKDADGKVYSIYESEEYMQKLATMRDYYKKGYIRPDVVSAAGEEATNTVKYGCWRAQAGPGSAATLSDKYGEEIVEISLVEEPVLNNAGARATMTAVSRTSKHPKEALQLIKLLNEDKDLYNLIYFGIEGKHYEKLDEDTVRIIEDGGYINANGFAYGSQFNSYYIEGQEDDLWKKADELNRSARVMFLDGFQLNTDSIKTEIANLSAVEKEYSYLLYGAEDYVDAQKEFVEKLKNAGLEKTMTEVQNQINDFMASKNQ